MTGNHQKTRRGAAALKAGSAAEVVYPWAINRARVPLSPRHEQEFARDAKQDVLPGPLDLASGTVSTSR